MRLAFLLLLFIAPAALAGKNHAWCGQVAPGKGLLHVERQGLDVMCGFIEAKADGPHRFVASERGTKVWISKQLVTDAVPLKAGQFYSIHIEAPASKDFELSWDWAGAAMPIPPIALYQPTATVGEPCARI